ncbi:hypothetical protein CLOSTMETH_01064 [[Clostridium] methylpentosum DSM 5476]|uniref:Uncharacterized protein n=1 Tax=[Clostridium] methylpentosum DSM 5476 TaxID=537013 RepID=C0EB47_9FIRM|nr:hypothetical protein CLOSTMETH_01064 [[Clostridium] methylpentosum DSM 5476]
MKTQAAGIDSEGRTRVQARPYPVKVKDGMDAPATNATKPDCAKKDRGRENLYHGECAQQRSNLILSVNK